MCAAVISWYNSQYSTWNRTRRIQQQPFLARVDTTTSRRATEMAQGTDTVVINMGDVNPDGIATEKKSDTLFGPNIGIVNSGPEWTEKKEIGKDELTPEIVKSWISKSKETNISTTTLQALVNLKRPTLRLSPLELDTSDDPEHIDSQHHHALEFEYDCDAPKCCISVHVLLSPKHRLADKLGPNGLSEILVFRSVVDGGFGKILKLEDGATLELGRFTHLPQSHAPDIEKHTIQGSSSAVDVDAQPSAEPSSEVDAGAAKYKRFTHFNFRKPVVDAERQLSLDQDKPKEEKEEDIDVGVKVTIRLAALDEQGKELPSVNEQITYLHIVRFGAAPVAVEGEIPEDNRPWVVKVVKREATIGPHTFHLHEIYGLSANSTTASQPVAQASSPVDPHVYPPVNPPAAATEDESSSECLLCLSAPREVVLLPCRHLVACRDCALNMIEFGAGGTITQPEAEPSTATAAEADNTPAATGADGEPPASSARMPRSLSSQPYTSLLRITTTPPDKDGKDEYRDSTSLEDHVPVSPPTASAPVATPTSRSGLLPRGGIFRAFGRTSAPPPDIERGQ
ncbi:hypothetical protein B0H21DRAFT_738501 [Amylocystis lapponica]|nr:hypothetical protein B0H21DRAFT_738501 [Amylocystis lapponica]